MPEIRLTITDELATELMSRSVNAVEVCLTALEKAVNQPIMQDSPKTVPRKGKMGRPISTESGDKLRWRSVGLEPSDWEWLAAEAASAGTTANEVVRKLVRAARTSSDGTSHK